jgi:hypothetical protein
MADQTQTRAEDSLAQTLAELNEHQKAEYERRLAALDGRLAEVSDEFRLELATTISKNMPAQYTNSELNDKIRNEEHRQLEEIRKLAAEAKEHEAAEQSKGLEKNGPER